MSDQDNRRSFRISETIYLKHEALTDEEFEEGLERRKLRLGVDDSAQSKLVDLEARLSETMFMLNPENDQIGRCLTLLNDKLNLAIEQLPGLRRTKAALTMNPPQTVDLGADGMVFGSDTMLQVGAKLHVQMLLETDNRFIETFAKVVRATESPNGSDSARPFGIAVEFHGMQPAVREILIQHMFSKESETLRMRRLQIEEGQFKG